MHTYYIICIKVYTNVWSRPKHKYNNAARFGPRQSAPMPNCSIFLSSMHHAFWHDCCIWYPISVWRKHIPWTKAKIMKSYDPDLDLEFHCSNDDATRIMWKQNQQVHVVFKFIVSVNRKCGNVPIQSMNGSFMMVLLHIQWIKWLTLFAVHLATDLFHPKHNLVVLWIHLI